LFLFLGDWRLSKNNDKLRKKARNPVPTKFCKGVILLAKIEHFCLSIDAYGKLGGQVVVSGGRRGSRYARKKIDPYHPNTIKQLKTKSGMKQAMILYQMLSDQDKEAWKDKARGLAMSGYNLFNQNAQLVIQENRKYNFISQVEIEKVGRDRAEISFLTGQDKTLIVSLKDRKTGRRKEFEVAAKAGVVNILKLGELLPGRRYDFVLREEVSYLEQPGNLQAELIRDGEAGELKVELVGDGELEAEELQEELVGEGEVEAGELQVELAGEVGTGEFQEMLEEEAGGGDDGGVDDGDSENEVLAYRVSAELREKETAGTHCYLEGVPGRLGAEQAVLLSWQPVTSARKYHIYRTFSSAGLPLGRIGTTEAEEFRDQGDFLEDRQPPRKKLIPLTAAESGRYSFRTEG